MTGPIGRSVGSDGWWTSRLSVPATGLRPSGYADVRDDIERAVAAGVDVLPLRGSTVTSLAPHVLAAVQDGARHNRVAGPRGLPELREAIAQKLRDRNGIIADPATEVLVTGGSKHALHMLLLCLLNPGDEVVFPTPSYTYGGSVELAGGVPVPVLMPQSEDFRWNSELLERAITPRTRVLLLSAPATPVGLVPTVAELEAMAALAERHDLVVVMDEAHENLVYDGHSHVSMAGLPDDVRSRVVTTYSMTKAHNLSGYRIGYLVGPRAVVDCVAKLLEWSVLLNPYLPQIAATAVLTGPQDWITDLVTLAQSNRDLLSAAFDDLDGISHVRPEGGMYHFLDISSTGLSDVEMSRKLLYEHGVPTEPGWISGSSRHLRITGTGSDPGVVVEATRRMTAAWEAFGRP
jgi:aspartate aminotransferase